MANKDLFKQAIADAKSIREAAIANAKLALEESLTPQLKELLAQRLAEMEEEEAPAAVISEEESVEEVAEEVAEEAAEEVAEVEEETLEEAIGADGLQAVAEAEEEAEEEGEGEEAGEEEAEGDSEESEDEAEEDMEIEDMSVEDLKDLIRDILAQEMGDAEAEAEDELEAGAEDMEGEDMTAANDTEINLEELMAELAELEGMESEEAINSTDATAGEEAGDMHGNLEEEQLDEVGMEAVQSIIQALDSDTLKMLGDVAKTLQTSPEGIITGMLTLAGVAGVAPLIKTINMAADLGKAAFSKVVTALAKKNMEEAPVAAPIASAELEEALTTIETLRNELNETNLLNAKLLYVNKVFKANNLSEAQKANVIAAFDKAETVKEVKLVYETVSENVATVGKKEVVKEAKGFASAAVGNSTKPEVIAEANQVVLRMQKLAGIIK